MKVLQVNVSDWIGARFNNLAVRDLLAAEGIDSRHLVWKQMSGETNVSRLLRFPGSRKLARAIARLERETSVHALLHLQSLLLPMHKAFRQADVVHYHIIHDGYFSILALPFLSRLKPSVWTFHDPWPMTGHCIYPMSCEKWTSGCGGCPQLDLPFPMKKDRTAFNFKVKERVLRHSQFEVVLASQYMMDFARRSPIASAKNTHHVPFGIDLNLYRPRPAEPARQRLGVLPGRTVIGVRAADGPFKGFEHFVAALDRLQTNQPLAIVTTHGKGQLNKFIGRHQIIELGWVDDEQMMLDSFDACDFFVMPSNAEAFGMMAIEAMACGKPLIVTSGTSLPEVAHAPDVGMVTRAGDPTALAAAMGTLLRDEDQRLARGRKARQIAEAQYDARVFAKRLRDVYAITYRRRGANPSEAGIAA